MDEPALKPLIGTFNLAFGLRGKGVNYFDVAVV